MILIAHRGNINGPCSKRENSPSYLLEAVDKGFYAEVDIWFVANKLYLGHDKPQYLTTLLFISNPMFICHAKNIEAFSFLLENNIHCFFHDRDDCTLTSKGYIWTYPGKQLTPLSICVMPEWNTDIKSCTTLNCYGICSDFVASIQSKKIDTSNK